MWIPRRSTPPLHGCDGVEWASCIIVFVIAFMIYGLALLLMYFIYHLHDMMLLFISSSFYRTCHMLFPLPTIKEPWTWFYVCCCTKWSTLHPVSVTRFPSFRTQTLEDLSRYLWNKWVPEQPRPWRKSCDGESCDGDRVYLAPLRRALRGACFAQGFLLYCLRFLILFIIVLFKVSYCIARFLRARSSRCSCYGLFLTVWCLSICSVWLN